MEYQAQPEHLFGEAHTHLADDATQFTVSGTELNAQYPWRMIYKMITTAKYFTFEFKEV